MELVEMTDDELAILQDRILQERVRRDRISTIPGEIQLLVTQYEELGGDVSDINVAPAEGETE